MPHRPFFLLTVLLVTATAAALAQDKAQQPNLTQTDLAVLRRADEILADESKWNRKCERRYEKDAKTWSLYTALYQASLDVTGEYEHRRPALEEVRKTVEGLTANKNYAHRLRDYNNDPETKFADIKNVIKTTIKRVSAQAPPDTDASALDQQLLTEAKRASQIMANLTYLCDEIGPRLTGSAALTRANEWAAEKMKAYGLTDVHLEPWLLSEGWERGPATGRLIEPNNGQPLSMAALGWTPGTNGRIEGDVVVMNAEEAKDLAAYQGKLKGAIVLAGAPFQLMPIEDIDKPGFLLPIVPPKSFQRPPEEARLFRKERAEFLTKEGAAAVLMDAGKPFNLLFTVGTVGGKDRPSAANRVPVLFVAHDQYAMLHRLASRPAPARTRLELDVQNKFVPGPVKVYNTVGEIKGSEKPDEFVVIGAHLDCWDMGQGATDNGAGSMMVLEAARVLAKCGIKPKRTIRFALFTGEEQGLHGSTAYVEKHKDEMPRTSACLVLDEGSGKVVGMYAKDRPPVRALLQEFGGLKELGVTEFQATPMGGSDQLSFEKAGVPGLQFQQELHGYRLSLHAATDTLDRAREQDLIQGASVMAITALRIANLDGLLPRGK